MSTENLVQTVDIEDEKPHNRFNFKVLSAMLRILGAGVLVSSLSLLLFQGWAGSEDILRFATLIGFSGLLTVAGFACARLLKENISARLFLGIALLSVVVNFAVAGALVYSGMQSVLLSETLPQFAQWHIGSSISASLLGLAAILVLIPVSVVGFRALARKSSATLFKLFVATNVLLLLPIRESDLVVAVGAVLAAIVTHQLVKLGRDDASLSTLGGHFAKALVFTPVLVLMGRSVFFYSPTAFAFATLSALIFIIFRQIGLVIPAKSVARQMLDSISGFSALMTAAMTTVVVAEAWPHAEVLLIPTFCAVLSCMLVELSLRTVKGGTSLRKISSLILAVGMSLNLFLYPSFVLAIFTMGIGLIVMSYGFSAEQKLIFAAGVTTVGIGFAYQIWLATTLFEFGNWGMLAILGTLTIVSASVIERHGLVLRNRLAQWRSQMEAWQA